LADALEPLLQEFGPAQLVVIIEAFEDAGLGGFAGEEVRPALQEVHGQFGVEVADQFEGLGIIGAQQAQTS